MTKLICHCNEQHKFKLGKCLVSYTDFMPHYVTKEAMTWLYDIMELELKWVLIIFSNIAILIWYHIVTLLYPLRSNTLLLYIVHDKQYVMLTTSDEGELTML